MQSIRITTLRRVRLSALRPRVLLAIKAECTSWRFVSPHASPQHLKSAPFYCALCNYCASLTYICRPAGADTGACTKPQSRKAAKAPRHLTLLVAIAVEVAVAGSQPKPSWWPIVSLVVDLAPVGGWSDDIDGFEITSVLAYVQGVPGPYNECFIALNN